MNKYKNVQKVIDGIVFDSGKEARRYMELKLLVKAKEIWDLELQPKFELQPAFIDDQVKKHRPITYTADFRYRDKRGLVVIEDVKGVRTESYKIKKKLFIYKNKNIFFIES